MYAVGTMWPGFFLIANHGRHGVVIGLFVLHFLERDADIAARATGALNQCGADTIRPSSSQHVHDSFRPRLLH